MKELRDFLDSPPGPKDPPKGSFYDVKLNSLLNGPGASPGLIIKTLQVLGSLMTFNAAAFTGNHVSNTIRFPDFLKRIPRLIQSILGTNWHPFVFQVESFPPLESPKRIPHNPHLFLTPILTIPYALPLPTPLT